MLSARKIKFPEIELLSRTSYVPKCSASFTTSPSVSGVNYIFRWRKKIS